MIGRWSIAFVLVLLALGILWFLRQGDGDPIPAAPAEPNAQATSDTAASAATPDAVGGAPTAPAEAGVVRSAVASDSGQPPIPADAKWLDVRVVDAATQQPVVGAEVRWSDGSVYQRIQVLPEAERRVFYGDQELIAQRLGWTTRSDANGVARITADANGTLAHGYFEGRYATGYFGGSQAAPPGGWQLALEPDRTLRAQVRDVAGRPAAGVRVAIRMFSDEGLESAGSDWIQPVVSAAPDGIAEFRHTQNWLRWGRAKDRLLHVATWRVALDLPGHEDPGVAFDEAAPPATPIVLQMPATGRLAVRLLYDGHPLTDNVSFCAFRGPDESHQKANYAEKFQLGDDGWARAPHVALGGELTVRASSGTASIAGTTPAPTGQGQEVRLELRLDGYFALAGRLLGPDGQLLRNATAQANVEAQVMMGGGEVKTDAQGRFLWLLTKGHQDTARLSRLVLSQTLVEGAPLRVSVAPRDLARGTNDLGDLQLTAGALVVAGRFVFDPPETKQQVHFTVETPSSRPQRDGAEVWERVENFTQSQKPDGAFEVRGEAKPGRYRLVFFAQDHLPVAPIEFRIGAADLVIPVAIGHGLAARCLPPADLPANQLRGVLVPAEPVAVEDTAGRSPRSLLPRMGFDRYTALAWGDSDPVDLRWKALPAGMYSLEIRVAGVRAPLATIPDVAVPPPAAGDPRLAGIDVRDRILVRKVKIVAEPKPTQRWSDQTLVFTMPQADPDDWEALRLRNEEVVIPAPEGPLDLLVLSRGFQPKRFTMTEAATTVTLDPWPSVDLLFPDLPPLPEGIILQIASHGSAVVPGQNRSQRYHTESSSGGLDGMMQPGGSAVEVKDGRARVQLGDGSHRLIAYLMGTQGGNRRPRSLRTIAPNDVMGGSNLAPIEVRLSADEIAAAVAEMQKEPAKK